MKYKEAFKLKPGDTVVVTGIKEKLEIREVDGHTTSLFFVLEDGCTYHHSEIEK